MILEHYSDKPLDWPPRDYKQAHYKRDGNGKPSGLWVSVKGEYDWPWWCRAEDFDPEGLAVRQIVRLAEDANVVLIKGENQLLAFDAEYGVEWRLTPDFALHRIDWQRVAKDCDGIIIAPYVWSCRLPMTWGGARKRVSDWYYGWDCASGCIWNGKAISAFEAVEQEEGV